MPQAFRVLVVDDDVDLRETLCEVLGAEGYEVSSAGSGREAFEWLQVSPAPDLILLDLVMPEMDGRKLFSLLQQDPTLCRIRVLGLTAMGTSMGENALPCPMISKPVGLADLLDTVAKTLARPPATPSPGVRG
jgi:CheY-like chemotaxis protein